MEGNNQNVCDVCGSGNGRCGKCGHYCGFGGRHILRWILGIIIITWVFSLGMKFGEFKSVFGGEYGGYGYNRMMRVQSMPMMYGAGGVYDTDGNVTFTTATVPSSGTVQVIKK